LATVSDPPNKPLFTRGCPEIITDGMGVEVMSTPRLTRTLGVIGVEETLTATRVASSLPKSPRLARITVDPVLANDGVLPKSTLRLLISTGGDAVKKMG
jgi:hypothetical protein